MSNALSRPLKTSAWASAEKPAWASAGAVPADPTASRGLRSGAAALTGFLLASLILAGCSFKPKAPGEFAQYPRGWIFKGPFRAVSSDGVIFTARTEDNDPKADLEFWGEALKTRMGQAGYRIVSDSACTLQAAPGRLLKLAAPVGNQDYLYWIAFAVSTDGDDILVVEAAGESKRFLARQDAIRQAIAETGF